MFSRPLRTLAVVAALIVVTAACANDETNTTAGAGRSAAAPGGANAGETGGADLPPGADVGSLGFTAPVVFGGEFDATTLLGNGKPTVLWFWAPWCTTCRTEAPHVVAAAEAFGGDIDVIGVAGRGDVGEMEQFVESTGTDGLIHLVDGDGKIWTDFGVLSQPAYAFLDDNGEVQDFVMGVLRDQGLRERFTVLVES